MIILLFILNFFLNAILVFYTSCILIELFLFIFRIKNLRIRYFARFLSVFKLVFDVFNYDFHKWAIKDGINPILAEKGSRFLYMGIDWNQGKAKFIGFFQMIFEMESGKTFSITDLFGLYYGSLFVIIMSFVFILASVFFLVRFILKNREKAKQTQAIIKQLKPLDIFISNKLLRDKIDKKKVRFYQSDLICSPCAYKSKIIFPQISIDLLNQKEIEAIIAHELEHILFYDNFSSKVISFIDAFLWYIPLKGAWIRKINKEKEIACDNSYQKYSMNKLDLINAIRKHLVVPKKFQIAQSLFNTNEIVLKRIDYLLTNKKRSNLILRVIQVGIFLFVLKREL